MAIFSSAILGNLVSKFGGSLLSGVKDTIMAYFPPDMTEGEKAKLEMKVQSALDKREAEIRESLAAEIAQFDNRIERQEGTAKDLMQMPFIGRIIIFFRGCQRPLWGFFTLYMDYKVLSNSWQIDSDSRYQFMVIMINLLVLGFLFGERTLINLQPLIMKILDRFIPPKTNK